MSNSETGSVVLLLLVVLSSAHILGYLFTRICQPRVIGEILAGLLLGPTLLGRYFPGALTGGSPRKGMILEFLYQLGLLLLMFVSGTETRKLFSREDGRKTGWLAAVGTGLPFLIALAAAQFLPLEGLMGAARNRASLVIVIGIAVAVTSIPVISRIFHDLGILHTRFASLVLGVAVLEDVALWAMLGLATALAGSATLSHSTVVSHVAATAIYFALGLTLLPVLLKKLNGLKWNILASASPTGYVVAILFAYTALAAAFDVSLVFAAYLAGLALTSNAERFREALDSISSFSFAVFIPIYFAVVGYKLDLGKTFSFKVLGIFLVAACLAKLGSVALAARLAGFGPLDTLNLAVATNARGGPGIVLASVAFDAHIINASFYTTLVLVAVLTSQAAGFWLEMVLRKGWPLLTGEDAATATAGEGPEEMAA